MRKNLEISVRVKNIPYKIAAAARAARKAITMFEPLKFGSQSMLADRTCPAPLRTGQTHALAGAGVDFVGFSYSTHTDGLVKPGAKDELLEGVYLKDPVFRLPSKTKMISKSAGHRK